MSEARYAREIPQRYRLEAGQCKKCRKVLFPPRLVCPECRGREFETVRLPREGKILTYTIINVAPSEFVDEAPYAVAVVELDGGARLTTQLVDCDFDQLAIDKRVKVEFRRLQKEGEAGILCYGYKCVLA